MLGSFALTAITLHYNHTKQGEDGMLSKLRALGIGAKNSKRPYKVAKSYVMPQRGRFEMLEERRMLSASGLFYDSSQALGSATSLDVALGDLDNDGDLDAFVSNGGLDSNQIYINQGGDQSGVKGVFQSGQSPDPDPSPNSYAQSSAVALGDLDDDGFLDAFVANLSLQYKNRVYLNDSNNPGNLSLTTQMLGDAQLNSQSADVELADLNGDSYLDAFVVNGAGFNAPNRVYFNDPNNLGTFITSTQSLGNSNSQGVALGDIDSDGDIDAVVANHTSGNRVWKNYSGTFISSGPQFGSASYKAVALGDLDGDGDLDAFFVSTDSEVWLNNGSGTFTNSNQLLGSSSTARDVSLGDFDGDGDLDAFVVGTDASQTDRVWINDGNGTFTNSETYDNLSHSIALGDLDGDGGLDAFVASTIGEANKVLFNTNATITVDSTVDSPDANLNDGIAEAANGDVTLRAAIMQANAFDSEKHVEIILPEGVYELDLTGTESGDASANDLDITGDITIVGAGAGQSVIDGGGQAGLDDRLFDVQSGGSLDMTGLTVTGGYLGASELGGGIYSLGDLTLNEVTIEGNEAYAGGGVYQSSGSLDMLGSSILGNIASYYAGGFVAINADVNIDASTIADNAAGLVAGMFVYNTDLNIENTTVSSNESSGSVGGVYLLTNGTSHTATFTNVTVTKNVAVNNGGIFAREMGGSTLTSALHNTIVADNTAANYSPDLTAYGSVTLTADHSLIGDNTGSGLAEAQTPDANGNLIGTSSSPIIPGLGPLANNGGPTLTHALLTDSLARDAGNDTLATAAGLTTDQRGSLRSVGTAVDIGAFEVQELVAPKVTNVTISGSVSQHDPFSFDSVDGSGDQLRTVPVGGADTISITFDESVHVESDDLYVVGLTTANVPTLDQFDYDALTKTATWEFSSLTANDQYAISLSDSVVDLEGNLLDGEWTNPSSTSTTNALVSEFPSGDGTAGGRFDFVMTLLAGDADLAGSVSGGDFLTWQMNFGGTNKTFIQADFDGDGDVDADDLGLWSDNYGTDLKTIFILADLDADGDVDDADYNTVEGNVGMTSGATYADGDLDGDGDVDTDDLDMAFAQLGLVLELIS